MDFKEFLPKEEAQEIETIEETTTSEVIKISPNQVYDIISSKKPDW